MIDITVIFSIVIVSFFTSKYISNIDIKEKYKTRDISLSIIVVYTCSFALCIIGMVLQIYYIKLISLSVMGVVLIYEIVLSAIYLDKYNKEFKITLRNEEHNINVGKIKKEMICSSFKNVCALLAFPFIILEKCIYCILNTIFK